ncbi:MAG: D-alanyl-D-alanine carboxypeptidase, partial [Pseudomonadota bacterium]
EYYNIFKRKSDHAAGKRIWSTNRLLSTYPGADGIKTGYTRAAGYNLVASARKGRKRVLAVLFGGRSSGDRARKVARLLDIGFARAPNSAKRVKPRRQELVVAAGKGRKGSGAVKRAPMPAIRPNMRASVAAALAQVVTSQAQASQPKGNKVRDFVAPRTADLPVPRGGDDARLAQAINEAIIAATVEQNLAAPGRLANVPIPKPRPVRLAQR